MLDLALVSPWGDRNYEYTGCVESKSGGTG